MHGAPALVMGPPDCKQPAFTQPCPLQPLHSTNGSGTCLPAHVCPCQLTQAAQAGHLSKDVGGHLVRHLLRRSKIDNF